MRLTDEDIRKLAEAVNNLQLKLLECHLEPAVSISVNPETGMAIRATAFSDYIAYDPKSAEKLGYCGHVCGVAFYIEPRRGEQFHERHD